MRVTSSSAYALFGYYEAKKHITSHNKRQDVLVSFSTPSLSFQQGASGWTVRLRPQPFNPLALIQLEDLIIRRFR